MIQRELSSDPLSRANRLTTPDSSLSDIEKDINVLDDNSKIISISGNIVNNSNISEKIPRLRASLLDLNNIFYQIISQF